MQIVYNLLKDGWCVSIRDELNILKNFLSQKKKDFNEIFSQPGISKHPDFGYPTVFWDTNYDLCEGEIEELLDLERKLLPAYECWIITQQFINPQKERKAKIKELWHKYQSSSDLAEKKELRWEIERLEKEFEERKRQSWN